MSGAASWMYRHRYGFDPLNGLGFVRMPHISITKKQSAKIAPGTPPAPRPSATTRLAELAEAFSVRPVQVNEGRVSVVVRSDLWPALLQAAAHHAKQSSMALHVVAADTDLPIDQDEHVGLMLKLESYGR